MGAALLALAVLSAAAEAQTQTPKQSTTHARATRRHKVEKPRQEGRQIMVHEGAPSWLTLGRSGDNARVGSGASYVTSTFDQPSPVEGTVSGYRGRERLTNQYDAGAPLLRF